MDDYSMNINLRITEDMFGAIKVRARELEQRHCRRTSMSDVIRTAITRELQRQLPAAD